MIRWSRHAPKRARGESSELSMELETSHKPTKSIKNERHQLLESGPSPSLDNRISSLSEDSESCQDSTYDKIPSWHSPSHREHSRSSGSKSLHMDREHGAFKHSHRRQDNQYPTRRLRSTSRDRNYNQYRYSHSRSPRQRHRSRSHSPRQHRRSRSRSRSPRQRRHSRSRTPDRYKDNHNSRLNRRSRSRSPRQRQQQRYRSRSRSPRRYRNNYKHQQYLRTRSQSPRHDQTSPRRNEVKPLEPSGTLPRVPDGWNSRGYYYEAQTSYELGGKDGFRGTNSRGGRAKIQDESTGERVKYSTVLEGMTREEKYYFIKEHGHPFAAVVGLPYFNPYGYVPLDDKLTTIIPKTRGKLFESSGQRLDYSEYVEGRAVMRAAVVANIPNKATIDDGEFLKWAHYGPSARLKVYNSIYASKPYYYHFPG
ncbi:hypothetical protein RSOL_119720 [Rhizoctonia solani AG-3 Rhs1AP]|uniref:Uncharacterized protein n=1 Tax=Rhizoctonia solani AG-3 Rhs1AP TaxID=1086054 RepID=X8J0W2_9AGAM|nr:hypothetical protein RSOL_119720 [Rhizoctonia solani AG-3 Rhs1AP]